MWQRDKADNKFNLVLPEHRLQNKNLWNKLRSQIIPPKSTKKTLGDCNSKQRKYF